VVNAVVGVCVACMEVEDDHAYVVVDSEVKAIDVLDSMALPYPLSSSCVACAVAVEVRGVDAVGVAGELLAVHIGCKDASQLIASTTSEFPQSEPASGAQHRTDRNVLHESAQNATVYGPPRASMARQYHRAVLIVGVAEGTAAWVVAVLVLTMIGVVLE